MVSEDCRDLSKVWRIMKCGSMEKERRSLHKSSSLRSFRRSALADTFLFIHQRYQSAPALVLIYRDCLLLPSLKLYGRHPHRKFRNSTNSDIIFPLRGCVFGLHHEGKPSFPWTWYFFHHLVNYSGMSISIFHALEVAI